MNATRLLIAAILLAGCSSAGTKVVTDFDREASFDGRETYTWVFVSEDQFALSGSPTRESELRVVEAVDSALAEKGFRKVSENPDLLVGFAVTTEDKTDVQQIYTDQSLGYVMGQTNVREYQEGTLILFFADPSEKQVIWQGSGTETFQNPSQQMVNERIGVVVKNVLKDFPPKG
jgi:hypothetical protein